MEFLNELEFDIKNGATIDEVSSAYPELKNNRKMISELHYDISQGATRQEIQSAYPELGEQKVDPLSFRGFYEYGLKPTAKSYGEVFTEAIPQVGSEIKSGLETLGADISKIQRGTIGQDTGMEMGLLGRATERFSEGQEKIKQAKVAEVKGEQTGMKSLLQSMGLLAADTSATIGDAFISGLKTLAPEDLEEDVKQGLEKAIQTKGGQWVAQQIIEAEQAQEYLEKNDPEKARDYDAIFGALNLAADAVGIGAIKKTGTGIKTGIKGIETGVKSGVKKGAAIAGETIENQKKILMEQMGSLKGTVQKKAGDLADVVEEKGYDLRNTLSGLQQKEITALKNTPREEVEAIFDHAKKFKDSPDADITQSPYYMGAEKAEDAFNKLDDKLKSAQTERVKILKESDIKEIDTTGVRSSIVDDIRDTFNVEGVTTKKGKIKYNPVEGRESMLDPTNKRDFEALVLLENATKSRSPLKMMDNIKKMQNMIYDSNLLNRVSKDMEKLITRSIGKLNNQFKNQVGPKYKGILEEMSKDIKIQQDLQRVFKAGQGEVGNRGEMAMKRLASGTTTSGEARSLALTIKDRLGIDIIKEARLRQLAMDIAGDPRGSTFFKSLKEGKSGLIERIGESLIDITPLSKEKTALKRAGTKLSTKKAKDGNTTNNSPRLIDTRAKKTTKRDTKTDASAGLKSDAPKLKASKKDSMKGKASIKIAIKKDLEGLTENNILAISKSIANRIGVKAGKVAEIIRQYIKKYGNEIKDKLGDLVDELADKVGVRSKLLQDTGKSLDDFGESELIKEAKRFYDAEDFYQKMSGSIRSKLKEKGLFFKGDFIDWYDTNIKNNTGFIRFNPKNKSDIQFDKHWGAFIEQNLKNQTGQELLLKGQKSGLTVPETTSFDIYARNEYWNLNDSLRNNSLDSRFNIFNKTLNSALDKLPNYEGVVYREGKLPKEVLNKVKKGGLISDKGFMSTSISEEATKEFATPSSIKYTIKSKTGKNISDYSYIPEEKEVLFKPDTVFKVDDIEIENGKTHLYLSEQ